MTYKFPEVHNHTLACLFISKLGQLLLMPVLFVWLGSSFCAAQETLRVIRFSNEHIINDQIWSIAQGSDGRMYFGTSDGLLTFNGSEWKVLPGSRGDIIRSVSADSKGQLFSGSYGEFGVWFPEALEAFRFQSLVGKITEGMDEKEEIWHILSTGDAVFFQSFSVIYKLQNGSITRLNPPGHIMFLHAVEEKLLFQKIGGGIYELGQTNSFQLLKGTDFLADKKVVFLLPAEKGLLIGTEQHGVFIWKNGIATPRSSYLEADFKAKQHNKGIQHSNGKNAFCNNLDGLFIVDKNGQTIAHLNKLNGLPDNTVLSLFEDKTGNLWVGLDRGIALVDLKNPLLFYTDSKGELGTVYSAALFENRLYVGTNHGVFYREEKNGRLENQFHFVNGTQGQVWELKVINNQLICGHNNGTYAISKNSIQQLSRATGGWVTLPFPNDPGWFLQGTYSGLVAYKKDRIGNLAFEHRVNDFFDPIKELAVDQSGAFWLAHPIKGLFRVLLDSTKMNITYLQKIAAAQGLPSDKMPRLALSEGQVFVKSNQVWRHFDNASGLLSLEGNYREVPLSNIRGMILNGRNSDWFEVLPNEVLFHRGTNTMALPVSLVGGYENIISLDSSRYLFCLNNGYAILNTKSVSFKPENDADRLIVDGLQLLGSQQPVNVLLTQHNLTLKNEENRIRLHVFQPFFTRTPLFRYQLVGLEKHWSEWTEKPEKEYFNLPSGQYTFKVESKFGGQQAEQSFRILPHWAQSSWAIMGYFLGIAGLLLLIQSFYKKRLKKAEQKMEVEQRRMVTELQMSAENEKLQTAVLNKSKELANSTINLVQKNEILLQLKKELSHLKKAAGNHLPGKEYQHLLHIIDVNLTSEQDWELFEENFNQVHETFLKKLKAEYPELTPGDLQLAAYLKMNLTSKEIAPLLHISTRGVENKRYRLRKKLGLEADSNLIAFMMEY